MELILFLILYCCVYGSGPPRGFLIAVFIFKLHTCPFIFNVCVHWIDLSERFSFMISYGFVD